MQRAAVLIGVARTGGLPELSAVQSGIARMAAWADAQGINGDRLVTLTDRDGKVRAHQVADAIERLIAPRTLDQLIVYFSGHGIHNRGDLWLLSDAPKHTGEAINVEGSLQLARYCGVNHVVLISDACRTAADGIQALGVTGAEVFPNDPVDGLERAVDAFFACARGKPALEVRDPVESAGAFSALYTEVLAECLAGTRDEVLDRVQEGGEEVALVRAWRLADALTAQVPPRLKQKLGRTPTVNQTPVARINSREGWLSRIPVAQLPDVRRSAGNPLIVGGGPGDRLFTRADARVPSDASDALRPPMPGVPMPAPRAPMPGRIPTAPAPMNAVRAADRLLSTVLSGDRARIDGMMTTPMADGGAGPELLRSAAGALADPFGPAHYETGCGFKLRGARVRAVHGRAVAHHIVDGDQGTLVRVAPRQGARSVLLELDDGGGVLLPAIPEFIAGLDFDDGELVHVAYEPSDLSPRWHAYAARVDELRMLRATVAAAAGLGVFRLSGNNASQLARGMQVARSVDPSMALYAAYAYHELGLRDDIRALLSSLHGDLGFAFFDIALLAADTALSQGLRDDRVLPAVPLLAQGWSLLGAFRAPASPLLDVLRRHLRPSLWTLFDPAGTRVLADALATGVIRR